jgi:diguanylate cyclase (GGDEF)-like protein/putative nucleotidyltransferase with HDIG domain/PAS domain S-box-containing protein
MRVVKQKTKLIIYLLLSIFIVALTLLYVVSEKAFVSNRESAFLLERDYYVNDVESAIYEIETMLNVLDNYISVQDNYDDLLEYLTEIADENENIASIYFGMPDKTMINSSGFIPPAGFDLTTRPWYQEALASEDVIHTSAFINATNDRVIITIAKAVYNNDDLFLGVIATDIDIKIITEGIINADLDENQYLFIIDGNNNVLTHPDLNLNEISLSSASDYDIPYEDFIDNYGLLKDINVLGSKGYIAYSRVLDSDYTLGLFINNYGMNRLSVLNVFLTTVFVVLVAVLISILLIYNIFIQRPLNKLVADIKSIDLDNNPDYKLNTSRRIGFSDARVALNNLLDYTMKNRQKAEERLKLLVSRNQRFNILIESASDLVFEVDKDFRYKEIFGLGLSILFKMKEEDFIGKTHTEVFGKKLGNLRERQYKKVLEGSRVRYQWDIVIDGVKKYFETILSPLLNINDEIIGIVGVSRDITEKESKYEEMEYLSSHDYLTGLYNRKYYYEHMDMLDREELIPYAVLNIDLNGLKIINDAFGHAVGDLTLKRTADILRNNLIKKEDVISRVGGDEFTVIIHNPTEEDVIETRNRLLKAFSAEKIKNITLSVAIGYYIKTDVSITADEVRKLAENDMFRHKVSERDSVRNKAISAILKTLTEKFEEEKRHSERVAEISIKIGKALELKREEINELGTAAVFHDIGKISIPDELINKPSKLTKEEFEIMKTHTNVGYEILRTADEYSELAIYASSHHERWDGLGYPKQLKGEEIPLFSRIICIADAYEAMTSDRPYRKRMSDEYATSEIIRCAGTQFDPVLAKVFVEKVLNEKWPEDQ